MEALEAWMQLAQQGDRDSYRKVLHASSRLARAYVAGRLGRSSECEDVVQEILLAVHKARHTYSASRPYKPWLFAIAAHKLNDYLRASYRRNARLEYSETLVALAEDMGEDVTFGQQEYEELNRALLELNDQQRTALRKTKLEGASVRETAQQMGISESAVKVTVHRAMKKLQRNRNEG